MKNYKWFKPYNNKNISDKLQLLINNNKLSMGNKTTQLENKIKKILNVKHVVLTTSGTSALLMATLAANIKNSHKIICPDMTWIATANPAKICGAKIYLVDSKKDSENVCFKSLNSTIEKIKPDIVYLVHLNGKPSYDDKFDKLKKKYKFFVIEDTAQSFLVKSEKNFYCGTRYEIGCFSLSITKLVHMVYGGFCVTNSDYLYERLITIRNNGVNALPENSGLELASMKGLNLKPSDIHATIGINNLSHRKKLFAHTKKIYNLYLNNLNNKKLKLITYKKKYEVPLYPIILVKNRNDFASYCKENNIDLHLGLRTLHETNLFGQQINIFPNATKVSNEIVRLPGGPGYNLDSIKEIIKIINNFI